MEFQPLYTDDQMKDFEAAISQGLPVASKAREAYEAQRAAIEQMATEPVVGRTEAGSAESASEMLAEMASNPQNIAEAAAVMGEEQLPEVFVGERGVSSQLTHDQELELKRMELAWDYAKQRPIFTPGQIEAERQAMLAANAREASGAIRGEPVAFSEEEMQEKFGKFDYGSTGGGEGKPPVPPAGEDSRDEEPKKRSNQEIGRDLKIMGNENATVEQRREAVNRLAADGLKMPRAERDISDETDFGKNERRIYEEAGMYLLGEQLPERTHVNAPAWLRNAREDLATENEVKAGRINNNRTEDDIGDEEESLEEREQTRRRGVEERLADLPTIIDPQDKIEEIKHIRKMLLEERPDGWQDKLSELRQMQVQAEQGISKVDVSDVGRQLMNLENPMLFDNDLPRQQRAAEDWLRRYRGKSGVPDDMVERAEAILNKEIERLTDEEAAKLLDYCFKGVFEMRSPDGSHYQFGSGKHIYDSLFGPAGWLVTELGKSPGESAMLRIQLKETIDALGLDNWMAARSTMDAWVRLRGTEEITKGTLSEGLFMAPFAEKFFAGVVVDGPDGRVIMPRSMKLPEMRDGRLEIVEISDIEAAVSGAMVELRRFFAGKTIDHYNVIQVKEQRDQIYENLHLNKYVAEIAFTELTSQLMLTELSADDPFSMMVDGTAKRIKLYNIKADKDAFIRAGVNSLLTSGSSKEQIFENFKLRKKKYPSEQDRAQEILEKWISGSLPRHLIPTGMVGMEEAFNDGHWLRERVLHLKSNAERANEVSLVKQRYLSGRSEDVLSETEKNELSNLIGEVDKASDTDTRVTVMGSALDVLMAIKESVKPESDLSKLAALKAKLLIHYKVYLRGAGWVNNNMTCDRYFDYVSNGTRPVKESEWASRAMLTVCNTFMFVHSYVDGYCPSPWDMNKFAEMAKDILSRQPQTEEQAFLGFDKTIRENHRRSFVGYVDKLWRDNMQLVNATSVFTQTLIGMFSLTPTSNVKFPGWYMTDVPPNADRVKQMMKDVGSTAWPNLKAQLDYK